MHGTQQAMSEDQIQDEQEQDPSRDEDLSGDGEADSREVRGQSHAQAQGDGAEEADVDYQNGKAERAFDTPVVEEDEDVDCKADDVKQHEYSTDWYIGGDFWSTS